MRLNMVKTGTTPRFAACVATVIVLGAGATPASAHFATGWYTYTDRDGNGACHNKVDPVNVVFYGSKAFARSTKHNIIRHMNWRDTGGSGQYFVTHGICYGMDFQQASGATNESRFHIRGKQGKDRDSKGRYETVGDAHHEDFSHNLGCNFGFGKHAVDQNGSNGSGFDQGRVAMKRRFQDRGHAAKYVRKGNKRKFRQCDGGYAGSNGLVAWIQVTHFKH
jgi:hypothetical protein